MVELLARMCYLEISSINEVNDILLVSAEGIKHPRNRFTSPSKRIEVDLIDLPVVIGASLAPVENHGHI
ncbi:hypothetical protein ACI3LW_000383 [Candidozyma auris]